LPCGEQHGCINDICPSLLGLIDGYGAFNGIPEKATVPFAETDLRGRWIGHQVAVEILNEKTCGRRWLIFWRSG
jgi:hypothetical protein